MGCGASATTATATINEEPAYPQEKPVQGTGPTAANVVQGSPPVDRIVLTTTKVPLEVTRQSSIVAGLADAAIAIAEESPMVAAGLAGAAASIAEEIVGTTLATGLAATAMSAAEGHSGTAPGLIKAAASSAVNAVQVYSQNLEKR
mmetsp:Transcript_28724/g.46269  ORF Transcript_28724/g.46269 Transcript_28724/m.46269 type:complete len:146 (-) Transcript_28724:233-670(-)